jgi:hypothetical protein
MNDNKLTYKQLAEKYLTDEQRAYYEGNIEYWILDSECDLTNEKLFLAVSFDWGESREGYKYWNEIDYNLNK